MSHTFTPLSGAFVANLTNGSTSRAINIPKYGFRPQWNMSVTIEGDVNNSWGQIGQPQYFRDQHVTTQAGTDRLYISNLNYFLVRGDNFWNGAKAYIYTVTNGLRNRIAVANVTDTRVNLQEAITPSGSWPRIQYDGGTAPFSAGQTLTGATSGATATIDYVIGTTASGNLILSGISGGPFQDNELITSATGSATANGANGNGTFSQIVSTTTFQWRVENFMRPSAGYWFRVGAVDASGNVGTYSSWVQFTSPASGLGTGTASNTFIPRIGTSTSGLSAPANVAVAAKSGQPAVAEVTWDAVGSASGYLIDISYQDPTLNASPEYVDLDTTGLEIPQGAIVVFEWLATAQTDRWASRVFGGTNDTTLAGLTGPGSTAREWVAYTGGDPAPSGIEGSHFWRRTMTASGNIFTSDSGGSGQFEVVHGSNYQVFYRVLEPGKVYRARLTLRANASITATFNIPNATITGSTSWALTTSWQTFEVDFTRATVLEGPGEQLSFISLTVPSACVIDVAEREYWDTTLNKRDLISHIKENITPGMFIRDHRLIKTFTQTVSMRQALSLEGMAPRSGTVHSLLRQCQLNNCYPWIQLEWHHPVEDWLNFIAYMCAPVSSGHEYSLIRQAQGQETPWIDVFKEVWLEFGNETWQGFPLRSFWGTRDFSFRETTTNTQLTSGQSAGAHYQDIITNMKTSPYWAEFRRKTLFYGGGWQAVESFEQGVAAYAPDIDATGPAGYNGGWETTTNLPNESGISFEGILEVEGDPDGITDINGNFGATGINQRTTRVNAMNDLGANAIVYEAGPGYQLNGLNGAVVTRAAMVLQEVAMKSRAAGTATIAAMSIRAAAGFAADNFFRLGAGDYWTSHAWPHHGGGRHMPWGLMKLIHEAVGYARVRKITLSTPPMDGDIELIEAFEYKSEDDPGSRVIAVVNRDIDPSLLKTDDPLYSATPSGTYAVTVPTGLASATGLSYYANVGNFREHNRYPVGFRLVPDSPTSTNSAMVGNPSGLADPLCVAFTYDWTSGTVPGDPSSIAINASVGAVSGGLPAGNCVLIWMQGCVDA